MLQIGKSQTLTFDEEIPYGAYLICEDGERIMLPLSQLPEDANVGDALTVFVYQDHDGQLTATTRMPVMQVGECGYVKVVGTNPGGAFVDWGLDKDLFVPKKQQDKPMEVGKSYVVVPYLDERDGRLTGSSKLHQHLREQNIYFQAGEKVNLLICGRSDLGYKAVVNNHSLGLLYQDDVFQRLRIGESVSGYIKQIRPDGKIDLTLRAPAGQDRDELSEKILQHLAEQGGVSAITDKADPNLIYRVFGVSKGDYKKALGALYKQQKISLSKTEIRLLD